MSTRLALCLLMYVVAQGVFAADRVASVGGQKALLHETDIRPILKKHCFHCHGEEDEINGKLDLRLVRTMLSGGESGPAIVPGQSTESLIFQQISTGAMPPGEIKKLTEHEIVAIKHWIDQGAKTARPEPDQPGLASPYTEEEQAFWSFQPIVRSALPSVLNVTRVQTPIDQFVLAKLEAKNLAFSAEADKRTLIRRLTFDLHGLPPDPAAIQRFLADESPSAYDHLVDELLDSPRYGERWSRHWLDLAGYADSDGYTESDPERKYAFKYRDYVIRALNNDKPWDQFLIEQLAGDELLSPPYTNLNPEQIDHLTATGFLRMAPDGTGDGAVDQNAARNDVMAETIKVVSSSLLGMTVGCAQCHNHRYDPITQEDYYRFRALFEPAYDWKNWRDPNGRLVSLWTDGVRQRATEIDAQITKLNDERLTALKTIVQEVFDRELAKLPDDQQPAAKAARDTLADKRTSEQQQLLKDHPTLNVDTGSVYLYEAQRVNQHNEKHDKLLLDLKQTRPPEDFVPCLTEVPGVLPTTHLFYRGNVSQPKQQVEPGELGVLAAKIAVTIPSDDPQVPTSGRRLAYARHLVSGQHPLVARVLVNRFWMHHFGRGLVETPGDFGALGSRPSHPLLLDWLASEFMSNGWRLKPLHRLIVRSATYRQSAKRTAELDAVDPDNLWLARMNVRRMEAEVLRDSLIAISGRMNLNMYGSPVPVTVDEVGQFVVGVDSRDSAGRPTGVKTDLAAEAMRRSIYIQVRRSMPLAMLETFDGPDMNPNCNQRNSSTVSPQSLLLMNNEAVLSSAERFAQHLQDQAGDNLAAQVQLAWELAFGVPSTESQTQVALLFLAQQTADFPAADQATPSPAWRALATYCQALVSSNRFLYID